MNGKLICDKIDYIQRNIHLGRPEDEEQVIDEDISPDQDGEFVPEEEVVEEEEEYEVETVEKDDDNDWGGAGVDTNDDTNGDADSQGLIDTDTDNEFDDKGYIEVWYAKAKLFLDHVNDFSRTVCEHPGFNLSLDEMMKLFKGRSSMTVQMKQKPIKEEFKFLAICDTVTGFVFYFVPDGLQEKKKKKTIVERVIAITKRLPGHNDQQYVIIINNYFTYLRQ